VGADGIEPRAMPASITRTHQAESISISPNRRPTSISLISRSPSAWRFRCPTPIYRLARFGRRRCGRPHCPICLGCDRRHGDQLDHGPEPSHQLRGLILPAPTPGTPVRTGQAALIAADVLARPRRPTPSGRCRRRMEVAVRRRVSVAACRLAACGPRDEAKYGSGLSGARPRRIGRD
jgi:hypothetical protein